MSQRQYLLHDYFARLHYIVVLCPTTVYQQILVSSKYQCNFVLQNLYLLGSVTIWLDISYQHHPIQIMLRINWIIRIKCIFADHPKSCQKKKCLKNINVKTYLGWINVKINQTVWQASRLCTLIYLSWGSRSVYPAVLMDSLSVTEVDVTMSTVRLGNV